MKLHSITVSLAAATLCGSAFAADVTYRKDIEPLVKSQCSECHGSKSPALADFLLDQKPYVEEKLGPRLASYGELVALIGWPDTGALMRRLDDGAKAGGKPGNMYKHLGKTDEERAARLALFKQWVGEGAWNLNRWKARGNVPAITKEELDKLELKY